MFRIFTHFQHTFLMEIQPEFKLIKSSRGGQKLSDGGYIYDKQRIHGELTHWQCVKLDTYKGNSNSKANK